MPEISPSPHTYDLVVVGGTPGGIACALAAARRGLDVLIVNVTEHLGGFMTSGCGGWEAPYDGARSPIFDETLRRIAEYYRATYGEKSPQYLASIPDPTTRSRFGRPKVEPRICEMIFEQMLKEEPNVKVLRGYYVSSAERQGDLLKSIDVKEMHGDRQMRLSGKIFADCTYEADLAAIAKVPYRVGREARAEYQEAHAGIIFTKIREERREDHEEPIPLNVRPVGEKQRLNGLDILLPESTGEADPAVMSYNYRLILTKNPENRVAIQKPANYDDKNFEASNYSILPGLPNDKIAWNGAGRLIGAQNDWPEADWPTREKIAQRHLDAALSWLWYMQNDPTAPPEGHKFWKDYGLAKDEFVDNGHLPYEIYVREARRISGRYVFTEHDAVLSPGLRRARVHSDSVAITDWPLDSVACTTATARDGAKEGSCMASDVWQPAQVPFRTMLPKGLDNLLVPVCLSATHVGWGTIRLEPVWMQTGEAAGLAAWLAIKEGVTPDRIDPEQLTRILVENRHMVAFFSDTDLAADTSWGPAVQYFGTRGFFNTYDARPDEALSEKTSERWIASFNKLASHAADYDPSAEAAQLPDQASDKSAPVLVKTFTEHLKASTPAVDSFLKARGWNENKSLTRAEACELLFAVLKTQNTL